MTEQVTAKQVVNSIGWLKEMDPDIEFSSADWATVNETGLVRLEGRRGDDLVDVVVKIVEIYTRPDWDYDDFGDDEDEDEDDSVLADTSHAVVPDDDAAGGAS